MKKRILSMLLALLMVISLIPASVLAEGEGLPTDPIVTDPIVTDPVVTDPPTTDPVVTDPPTTDPMVTDPPTTDPVVTDPPTTDPVVTDPPVTDPVVTDPPTTDPVVTDPPATEAPAPSAFEQIMAGTTTEEMYLAMVALMETDMDSLMALTFDEIEKIEARALELDPEKSQPDTQDVLDNLTFLPNHLANVACPDCEQIGEHKEDCPRVVGTTFANNVHNVTKNLWYSTLSAAVADAEKNNYTNSIIEVHNSFTESSTVKIRTNGLTIRAAAGKNPVISWTQTSVVDIGTQYTKYNCIVVYTSVTTSTTLGSTNGTGTLTFDATQASNESHKRQRARVIAHCGTGRFNLLDGIVITGGNTGGGDYDSGKNSSDPKPSWSGEIAGSSGYGSGILMYNGDLIMTGGTICDNYSLWGTSSTHNYVGSGGGVYLRTGTTMIMNGGTITRNAAGSGGGGGISVDENASLVVNGGNITYNVCRFASGGGIGVSKGNKGVTINGGYIAYNEVSGHGGGLFARGDAIPLKITGGTFEGNIAGSYGGGVLFWTVGDDLTKNTVIISGNAKIINNTAEQGGGVSIGREVLDGKPIGNYAKLEITGNPVISGNTAKKFGGGIEMQSDEFSNAVNTVVISGGTFENNESKEGAGIYVPGGTVTITGGSFKDNKASNRGGAIFTGGGTLTISNAFFQSNEATNFGGGAYVVGGTVTLNSGTFSDNKAKSGGAVYITKEGTTNTSSFTMNNGSLLSNTATENGGAVFINDGTFTMYNGTVSGNTATKNGGAVYVKGNVTIRHGILNENTAENGGAVYMAGTESTTFIMESGKMIGNTASIDGGAVCAENGNMTFGLKDCTTEQTLHATGYYHPVITNNTATNCGGGVALMGSGNITMYCGEVDDNSATNRGRGLNVYMNKGNFHYHTGANVGKPSAPELVIIGGEVFDYSKDINSKVTLTYHHCNDDSCQIEKMSATATAGTTIHLPDGEQYWTADTGYRFFGWRYVTDEGEKLVRSKNDYQEMGFPITVPNENTELYALWAPIDNKIQYVTNGAIVKHSSDHAYESFSFTLTQNPTSYKMQDIAKTVSLPIPVKAGYTFEGWYIYQDEGQNANWGWEPDFQNEIIDFNDSDNDGAKPHFLAVTDNKVELNIPQWNFGDLTLIAKFKENSVTINYQLVGDTAGADPLNPSSETILEATDDAAGTVVENLKPGYEFVGWFSDSECTQAVGTDATFVPEKVNGLNVAATYYAKVKLALVDIKIVLDSAVTEPVPVTLQGEPSKGGSLKLDVAFTGNTKVITVKDVPVGSYEVVPQSYWNWRYKGKIQTRNATETGDVIGKVLVNNVDGYTFYVDFIEKSNNQWLNGYNYWPKAN